jgi:hypothetical protein
MTTRPMNQLPEHCPACTGYPCVGIAVGARMAHAEWRAWCDCGAVRGVGQTKARALRNYKKACATWRKEHAPEKKRKVKRGK